MKPGTDALWVVAGERGPQVLEMELLGPWRRSAGNLVLLIKTELG